jgi:hypothetical protein
LGVKGNRRFVTLLSILMTLTLICVYLGLRLYNSITADVFVKEKTVNEMTTDERLEDFEYMYNILENNFPYFEVEKRKTGYDWLSHREEFKEIIKNVKSDDAFYTEMSRILRLIQSGHTNLISPSMYGEYRQLYNGIFNKPWIDVLNNDISVERYSFWEEKVKESAVILPIGIVYVEGHYVVVDNGMGGLGDFDIPEYSILKKVRNQDVDDYVKSILDKRLVVYDFKRKKLKINKLNIPCSEGEKIELSLETPEGKLINRTLEGEEFLTRSSLQGADKVYSRAILKHEDIAYLKVTSFSAFYTEKDREGIHGFLKEVKDYPYLIIDIRGNGGGDTSYWEKNIVGPLIDKELSTEFYYAFREGVYIKPFINARGMSQKPINKIPEGKKYPEELKRDFESFYFSEGKVKPLNSLGFKGKIYLLVDDYVYSSAEAFAVFAKSTGWATIVGTETGGDGIGVDPALVALPNSGLIFRFPLEMGLNPDGTSNEEFHTMPDIYVEQTYEDFVNYMNFKKNNKDELLNPYDTVLNRVFEMIN